MFKTILFALILSTQCLAGISGKLMQSAATHPEHKELEKHAFLNLLKDKQFKKEQIAQFLKDRIYVLKILEQKLLNPIDPNDQTSSPNQKIFFRSWTYEKEFYRLIGKQFNWIESDSARDYGDYLSGAEQKVQVLHLWLFLMGETFGAQSMGNHINAKFKNVGLLIQDFENMSLSRVRWTYNQWVDAHLKKSGLDFQNEIKIGFQAFNAMMTKAQESQPIRFCQNFQIKWSENCYTIFGF